MIEISLDTNLTLELISEGAVNEIIHNLVGVRKNMKLQPENKLTLRWWSDEIIVRAGMRKYKEKITRRLNLNGAYETFGYQKGMKVLEIEIYEPELKGLVEKLKTNFMYYIDVQRHKQSYPNR